jgi:glucose-6-phosphate isomerase
MNDFDEMLALETGAIANKDENLMVGHYWLGKKSLSPTVKSKIK